MKRSLPAAAGLAALVAAGALGLTACGSAGPHVHTASGSPSGSQPAAPAPSGSAAATATGTAPRTGTSPHAGGTATSGPPAKAPYPTPGREPDAAGDQAQVLNSLPGSGSSTCAQVGTRTDLRSGSVAAGNFRDARTKYAGEVDKTEVPEVFLYVIPEHAASMRSVTVTVDPVGAGATKSVTSTSIEQADRWSYFAVNVPIRASGTYRLTMVSGRDKGCFEVSFTK